VRALFKRVARHGEAWPVAHDHYFTAEAVAALARYVAMLNERDGCAAATSLVVAARWSSTSSNSSTASATLGGSDTHVLRDTPEQSVNSMPRPPVILSTSPCLTNHRLHPESRTARGRVLSRYGYGRVPQDQCTRWFPSFRSKAMRRPRISPGGSAVIPTVTAGWSASGRRTGQPSGSCWLMWRRPALTERLTQLISSPTPERAELVVTPLVHAWRRERWTPR
jgi:hypothetical protein